MMLRMRVLSVAAILISSVVGFSVTIDDFAEGATIAFPAGETVIDGTGGTYSIAGMTFVSGADVTLRNMTVNLATSVTVSEGASLTLDKVAYNLATTTLTLNVGKGAVLAFNNGSTFYGRYVSFFNVANGYATLSCEGGTFETSLRWTPKSGDAYSTFKAGQDGVLKLKNGASTQMNIERVNLVADRGQIEFSSTPWSVKPQGAYELTIPATGYGAARLQSPLTAWNLTAAATLAVDARAVVVGEEPVTIPLISAQSLSIADKAFYENAVVQVPEETVPSFVVDATSLKLVLTPSHLHTWEETGRIVEPTATETGSRFIVCSSCHLEREVVLPAYGIPGEPDEGAVTYTWSGLGYGGNWKHPVNWVPSVTPCRGYPDGPEAMVVFPEGKQTVTGDGKETVYAISNVTWKAGAEVELSDLTLKSYDATSQFNIGGVLHCTRAGLDVTSSYNKRLGLIGSAVLDLGEGSEVNATGGYLDLWSTSGATLTYRDGTIAQTIRWSAKTGDVLCVTNAVLNFTYASNGTQMNYAKATIKVQEGTIQHKTNFTPQSGVKFEFLLPAVGTTADTVCLGGWDTNAKTTRTIDLSALTSGALTIDVSQVKRSGLYPIIRAEALVLPEGGLAALNGTTFITRKRQTAELVYDPEADPNVLSVRTYNRDGLFLSVR